MTFTNKETESQASDALGSAWKPIYNNTGDRTDEEPPDTFLPPNSFPPPLESRLPEAGRPPPAAGEGEYFEEIENPQLGCCGNDNGQNNDNGENSDDNSDEANEGSDVSVNALDVDDDDESNFKKVLRDYLLQLNITDFKDMSIELDGRVQAFSSYSSSSSLSSSESSFESLSRSLQAEEVTYGISMVQADQVWNVGERTPVERTICIVDGGYALGHPDLPQGDRVDGLSISEANLGPWSVDANGHGTRVAGIIGAIGGNGEGVVGVNPDPTKYKFYIAKALDSTGFAFFSEVIEAVNACANQAGANVISLSLGSTLFSSAMQRVGKELYDRNILLVAAAGNFGGNDFVYPASFEEFISVGSINENEERPLFSQHNAQVELAAPGVDIRTTSTNNGGTVFTYQADSGTSMSAPFVAGVAARLWSYFPECTNNQIRNVLLQTAKDIGEENCDQFHGYGILKGADAAELLATQGCEAAGGNRTTPLSAISVGGCYQLSGQGPPEPVAPTCTAGSSLLTVNITTDMFPRETTWTVVDRDGNEVASGGPYNEQNRQQPLSWDCLPDAQIPYTFTIFDSDGDGICCLFGSGSWEVLYGDLGSVGSGSTFAISENVTFPDVPDPTSAPTSEPSLAPSESPMASPTVAPSNEPTTSAPTNVPTHIPTTSPTTTPSSQPVAGPTRSPVEDPTEAPSTTNPTVAPSSKPPTESPSTSSPTESPFSQGIATVPTLPPQPPTDSPRKLPTILKQYVPTSTPTSTPMVADTVAPVTPSPTNAPITESPTKAPFFENNQQIASSGDGCSDANDSQFKLDLTTDSNPRETSWRITNGNGDTVASGGPYYSENTRFSEFVCLSPALVGHYTFVILDSYGDGLEKRGPSKFKTSLNGKVFGKGRKFRQRKSFSFMPSQCYSDSNGKCDKRNAWTMCCSGKCSGKKRGTCVE